MKEERAISVAMIFQTANPTFAMRLGIKVGALTAVDEENFTATIEWPDKVFFKVSFCAATLGFINRQTVKQDDEFAAFYASERIEEMLAIHDLSRTKIVLCSRTSRHKE